MYLEHPTSDEATLLRESNRLEYVTTCVGFDDLLEVTLSANMPHVDSAIVVTSHADAKTKAVAKKFGALTVETDLFRKNDRRFNKGAAINVGFDRFQWRGWRMHLDADIALPDNFRRMLFNLTHLDSSCIYGADRVDVHGRDEYEAVRRGVSPQHDESAFLQPRSQRRIAARFIDPLRGYVPIGFFQLWHSTMQKPYPYSLGSAAHDDVMFASAWPEASRRLLPTVICYHLVSRDPKLGDNWDGVRRQPRWDK